MSFVQRWGTPTEVAAAVAAGDWSAEDIARDTIDRIRSADPAIGAFTHIAETAIEAAAQIDADRRAGRTLGPLAGVPVAVKDAICTADMPTTCGSQMLADYRSPHDATIVRKLRDAGAVIVGKTNMDDFAMGASTETSAAGPARNPHDVTRTPGGSSGGAAACVAAGMVGLSVGSDTGGSIRQPAAFCGVTGLKPTYGRVSRYGLVAFASSLDQIGPIGNSVADCALLLHSIAGHEPRDTTSIDAAVPGYVDAIQRTDLKGVKVGVLRAAAQRDGVADSVRDAVDRAADIMRRAGAELVPIEMPHDKYWVPTYYVIAPSEASSNLSRFDGVHYGHRAADANTLSDLYTRSRGEGFGDEVKRRIMIGTYALSEGYADQYYNQALKVRRLIKHDYDQAFEKVDVILGPTTPTPAFGLGEKIDDPLAMYLCDAFTVGANLAGVPAMSLPAGTDDDGLPIGVQLQAPVLDELNLFGIAQVLENGWPTPSEVTQ